MAIMSNTVYLTRHGRQVPMTAFSATDAKNEFGQLLALAVEQGGVAITRHDSPKAVLLGIEEYQRLVDAGAQALAALTSEFDALLEGMQTPRARKAMAATFEASPARLGKAAVAAAKRG